MCFFFILVGTMGFEPTASCFQDRHSTLTELYSEKNYLVGIVGFEPTTLCTPCKCATRLRYTPIKLKKLVGIMGFEPMASCFQGKHATRLRHIPMLFLPSEQWILPPTLIP